MPCPIVRHEPTIPCPPPTKLAGFIYSEMADYLEMYADHFETQLSRTKLSCAMNWWAQPVRSPTPLSGEKDGSRSRAQDYILHRSDPTR